MSEIGLYFHVPFCDGKCPYCDFYSLPAREEAMDAYVRRLRELLPRFAENDPRSLGTVYFGGGTPSLLGPARLSAVLEEAARCFSLSPEAEITCEANPTGLSQAFFPGLRAAGFNRLSLGLQSANQDELRLLGRRHSPQDAARAVEAARAAGFGNLSLDLMLALPGGSMGKLESSIDFAVSLRPEHLSTYILKVEPDTPFARQGVPQPEEDRAADEYLFCVEELARRGYCQYEISNFAQPGFESRHNLVYWRCQEYLGLGPGAHSFLKGRRFFWARNLSAFLQGAEPVDDGPGGSFSEFAMLNLRLTQGLTESACEARFGRMGKEEFRRMHQGAQALPASLFRLDGERVALTPEGFLVSNAILARLLPDGGARDKKV